MRTRRVQATGTTIDTACPAQTRKRAVSLSPIQKYLDALRARVSKLSDGNVANYIPELALVDPDHFGICIASHDGFLYQAGDSEQPFTIQSISKALTYGLALR